MARAFDPTYASQHLTEAGIDEMMSTILPFMTHIDAQKLKAEMPAYMAAAKDIDVDHADVEKFSEQVLSFWRSTNKTALSEWRKAARITFTLSPNSATCERVFSLLKIMYGEQQDQVLADHIQASIMMRYNGRPVLE